MVPPVSAVGDRPGDAGGKGIVGRIKAIIADDETDHHHRSPVPRLPPAHHRGYVGSGNSWWWLGPLNLGVLAFLGSVVLLYFGPPIMAMLLAGPLAAWADILRWLWAHGEISIPLAVVLALVVGLPWSRQAVTQGVERGLESLGIALVWGLLVTVGVGVITGVIAIIVVWFIPGVWK